MEVKRDLENVTFERETLMSAEAPEGEELTEEQLDQRYARIAELRSQEMRLQEELTELEKKGVPQVTMENIARVIEMWTKIPASKIKEEEFKRLARAGCAAEAAHRRAGRGCHGAVPRHPAGAHGAEGSPPPQSVPSSFSGRAASARPSWSRALAGALFGS